MRRIISLLSWATLLLPVQPLYFFVDVNQPKCFYEELSKGTLVVGHYTVEEYDNQSKTWTKDGLTNHITIDELFDNDHRVVSQKGLSSGRFTFSASDYGEHRICFTISTNSGSKDWLSTPKTHGSLKLTLDISVGDSTKNDASDKGKILHIVQRVKDLNSRMSDIRREQIWQREREAEFRDQSESTNGRVVRWALIQLVVLGITCTWQLSHLRSFFIKQKLT
ncbi:Protein ERP1 [Golovinomyces cichoracearum]|uniref:Protein ERP1 n=1 Tax=Golovinomyces cichoracearum TaxID=62708 RepID=A0A420IW62_9PEZI|nr:Protein ERP1 [Golovinomyces cichoracearum]